MVHFNLIKSETALSRLETSECGLLVRLEQVKNQIEKEEFWWLISLGVYQAIGYRNFTKENLYRFREYYQREISSKQYSLIFTTTPPDRPLHLKFVRRILVGVFSIFEDLYPRPPVDSVTKSLI